MQIVLLYNIPKLDESNQDFLVASLISTSEGNWSKFVQMRRDPQDYCVTLLSIQNGAVDVSTRDRARPTPEEKLIEPLILSSLLWIALTSHEILKALLCLQRHLRKNAGHQKIHREPLWSGEVHWRPDKWWRCSR